MNRTLSALLLWDNDARVLAGVIKLIGRVEGK